MKTPLFLAGITAAALSMSSCVSPYAGPNESVGSVVGATVGAVAGAIIGHQTGRPLEGAAIGGSIGSMAGGSLGHAQDAYTYGYPRPVRVYRTVEYGDEVPVYALPPGYAYSYSTGRYYRRY
jgi:uncharacterized membrane protein